MQQIQQMNVESSTQKLKLRRLEEDNLKKVMYCSNAYHLHTICIDYHNTCINHAIMGKEWHYFLSLCCCAGERDRTTAGPKQGKPLSISQNVKFITSFNAK